MSRPSFTLISDSSPCRSARRDTVAARPQFGTHRDVTHLAALELRPHRDDSFVVHHIRPSQCKNLRCRMLSSLFKVDAEKSERTRRVALGAWQLSEERCLQLGHSVAKCGPRRNAAENGREPGDRWRMRLLEQITSRRANAKGEYSCRLGSRSQNELQATESDGSALHAVQPRIV